MNIFLGIGNCFTKNLYHNKVLMNNGKKLDLMRKVLRRNLACK